MPALVERPPEGEGWQHEVKLDGYPVRDAEGVRVSTRRSRLDVEISRPTKAAGELDVESANGLLPLKSVGRAYPLGPGLQSHQTRTVV